MELLIQRGAGGYRGLQSLKLQHVGCTQTPLTKRRIVSRGRISFLPDRTESIATQWGRSGAGIVGPKEANRISTNKDFQAKKGSFGPDEKKRVGKGRSE